MNNPLDIITVFRVSALLFLLLSVMTWMMLGRPRRGASLWWCWGGTLVGVSVWLISLRGQISDVWSYSVAQALFLGSFLVLSQSLRMDLKRTWGWPWLLAVVLAYGAVIELGFADKGAQELAVLVRLVNCVGLSILTASAWLLARQERSRNAWFMTLGYGLMTASMVLAAVATVRGQANLQTLQNSLVSHLLGGVAFFTLLLSYLGYWGLALERSLRHNMALRQAQWQSQQWHERSQALTLLDRQHTLGALANSLGHAILQPLTATLLQVQIARRMLQTTSPDVQQVKTSLAQVVQGLRRSADMVEHIRNFLRPKPGAAPAATEPLQAVVQDAHDLLRQELMYQGVTLHVSVPSTPLCVHAERLPLTQALVQVLRNAMQAVQGQPRRSVSLVLAASGSQAWIEVSDSGPGFSPDWLAPIQANKLPTTDALAGMGLTMTRGILAQFQGHLSLENMAGAGARVRMTLPLQADPRTD